MISYGSNDKVGGNPRGLKPNFETPGIHLYMFKCMDVNEKFELRTQIFS